MMGQSTGQRSTLTINHGRFYMDTSNNCTVQNPGGNPPGSGNPPGCLPYQLPNGKPQVDVGVSVFQPGQTYYVYFIYGRASTYLTFDIYLGPNDETGKWAVNPVKGVFDGEPYEFCTVGSGPPCNMTGEQPWLLTPTYDRAKNVLTVTVDLSKSTIVHDFSSELAKSCQPLTYCAVTNNVCGCKPGTNCKEEKVGNQIVGPCTWGPKDPDCPDTGCYGFSFTMPSDWPGPPAEHVDPPDGVLFSTGDPYFTLDYNDSGKPNVNFGAANPAKFGQGSQCDYRMP
jgi:cell migration-inducing and hyaluronan-binding protein